MQPLLLPFWSSGAYVTGEPQQHHLEQHKFHNITKIFISAHPHPQIKNIYLLLLYIIGKLHMHLVGLKPQPHRPPTKKKEDQIIIITFPNLEVLLIDRWTGWILYHLIQYAEWSSFQFLYNTINRPPILQVNVIIWMSGLDTSMLFKLIGTQSLFITIGYHQYSTKASVTRNNLNCTQLTLEKLQDEQEHKYPPPFMIPCSSTWQPFKTTYQFHKQIYKFRSRHMPKIYRANEL